MTDPAQVAARLTKAQREAVLEPHLERALRSALRFAASRSAISALDERDILAALTRPTAASACPHGIRSPWQCDKCDAADPMPQGYDPLATAASAVEVERVARAIHGAKMEGHNPDCLYEHHEWENWPVDDRREYADPFTGKTRVQLFHKAWRRYESAAQAAIAAMRPVGEMEALRKAILAVVDATRDYLPPDGIGAQECLNRILAATDNPEINPIIRSLEDGN